MPDDTPISGNAEVMASIAQANQAEVSGDHNARAAAATRALEQWAEARRQIPSDNPKNAIEAGQLLESLTKIADFRNDVEAGKTTAVKLFRDLNKQVAAGDPVELALAGVSPAASVDQNSGSIVGERDLPAAVNHLRVRGYTDGHIREILSGKLLADDGSELSEVQIAERVTNGERMLERLSRDSEWRRRYLSGDRDAAALLGAVTATLAVGKK
jgi:hypothetical protein